jgi:hypothetical protein
MRALAIGLILATAGHIAAQETGAPTADFWVRAAVSGRAGTRVGGPGGALFASANMGFGGMVNELRQVTFVSVESRDTERETAVLIGARRIESNRFLSVAAGIGLASHTVSTLIWDPGLARSRPVRTRSDMYPGLALELHGTGLVKSWLGVGGGIVANINARSSLWAMILSLDVGDLPHRPKRP